MKYEGSCHCGELKMETDLEPMLVYMCNCNSCRKKYSLGLRLMYASDEVKFIGETTEYSYKGGSGGNIYAQHCKKCLMFSHATFDYMEGMSGVHIGMYSDDDAKKFTPKLEIFTDETSQKTVYVFGQNNLPSIFCLLFLR